MATAMVMAMETTRMTESAAAFPQFSKVITTS